jgi:hypothetical protein
MDIQSNAEVLPFVKEILDLRKNKISCDLNNFDIGSSYVLYIWVFRSTKIQLILGG